MSRDVVIGAPTFFFFALAFFLLLSLGLSPDMPALQISAYRAKKPPRESGSTTVESLTLSELLLADLPLVARMRTGRGFEGCRSAKGSSVEGAGMVSSWPWDTMGHGSDYRSRSCEEFLCAREQGRIIHRFWTRYIAPWSLPLRWLRSSTRPLKNCPHAN